MIPKTRHNIAYTIAFWSCSVAYTTAEMLLTARLLFAAAFCLSAVCLSVCHSRLMSVETLPPSVSEVDSANSL